MGTGSGQYAGHIQEDRGTFDMGGRSVSERRGLYTEPCLGTCVQLRNGLPQTSGKTLTEDSLPTLKNQSSPRAVSVDDRARASRLPEGVRAACTVPYGRVLYESGRIDSSRAAA